VIEREKTRGQKLGGKKRSEEGEKRGIKAEKGRKDK
jgi:hypothetical protein